MNALGPLYRAAVEGHGILPYYLSRAGYALPPWHYFILLTRRCNLRCKMCINIDYLNNVPAAEQRRDELSTEALEDLIDQIPAYALTTFSGGEPFLRKDFMHLLRRASSRCRTHFITNASLIPQETVEEIVDLAPRRFGGRGVLAATVSIDGIEPVHDRIRRVKNGYRKCMEAIDRIVAARERARKSCPKISVTACILADNVDTLHELPAELAKHKVSVLNLNLEMRTIDYIDPWRDPRTYTLDEFPLPEIAPDKIERLLRDVREAAAKVNLELRLPRMPDAEIVKYYQRDADLDRFHCGAIWSKIAVTEKGFIQPCHLAAVGKSQESTFGEAWNGSAMRRLRRDMRRKLSPACMGCCFLEYGARGSMKGDWE